MAASAVLQPAQTSPRVRFAPERLRAARESAGLTLRDVAAATGWHHSTPNRYERGDADPGANALALLAELYRVQVGDLFVTLPYPQT